MVDLHSLLQAPGMVLPGSWENQGKKAEFLINVWLNLSNDHNDSPLPIPYLFQIGSDTISLIRTTCGDAPTGILVYKAAVLWPVT